MLPNREIDTTTTPKCSKKRRGLLTFSASLKWSNSGGRRDVPLYCIQLELVTRTTFVHLDQESLGVCRMVVEGYHLECGGICGLR